MYPGNDLPSVPIAANCLLFSQLHRYLANKTEYIHEVTDRIYS